MACRRVFRSSSQGEVGLFTQPFAVEACFAKKPAAFISSAKTVSRPVKPSPSVFLKKESPSRPVFTIGSPEKEVEASKKSEADRGYGEFLKACSQCKKKLDKKDDVFMYGFLGAYCSTNCRNKRIHLDGFNEEVARELAARIGSLGKDKVGALTPIQRKFLGLY